MIYLLSIDNDRSQALTRLLREGGCADSVECVRLTGDPQKWTRYLVDRAIAKSNLEPARAGDVIVPTGAADTEWFLSRADCTVGDIVHGRASLNVFDKSWLLGQAVRAGIPIPVTWDCREDIGAEDFPVFYKADYEWESGIRGLLRHPQDLPSAPSDHLIFQEYIDSPGTYGVGFLAKDGEVLVSYSHFESSSNPSTGGGAVVLEHCSDTRPLRHTERLVAHLGYSGWGLAEFKYCPIRMDYVLMEINAKLWGSCEMAFRNEPKFLRSLFGLETEPQGIERMVFLKSALARGPRYLIRHRHELAHSRRVLYRGWGRILVIRLLPKELVKVLKRIRAAARKRGRSACPDPGQGRSQLGHRVSPGFRGESLQVRRCSPAGHSRSPE